MIQFEELRLSLLDYEEKLKQLREALGLDAMNEEIAKLEAQTAEDGFWNDLANSQKVQQRISQLKNKVAAYTALENEYNDALVLIGSPTKRRISICSTNASTASTPLYRSSRP